MVVVEKDMRTVEEDIEDVEVVDDTLVVDYNTEMVESMYIDYF